MCSSKLTEFFSFKTSCSALKKMSSVALYFWQLIITRINLFLGCMCQKDTIGTGIIKR